MAIASSSALAFEIGLGRALGFSRDRVLPGYNPAQGGLMSIGMGVLLFALLRTAKVAR